MDATAYLYSLGLRVATPEQQKVGRLALAGDFTLEDARGVLLRPKRGQVSDRYLELLADEGYEFVVVDSGHYPAFYAREGECFVPVRALPVRRPERFPTPEVLDGWAQLIATSARTGDASRIGVAQLVAWLDGGDHWGPRLVRTIPDVAVDRLGGDESVDSEPLRTAAALLAGHRSQPSSADEVVRLAEASSSLVSKTGSIAGLARPLAPLLGLAQVGERRLLASAGAGAEVAALMGAVGTVVMPIALRALEPLLDRILPGIEHQFADFLDFSLEGSFDGVVVVPPIGRQLSAAHLERHEVSKHDGKAPRRVPAEILYVERGLAATADGGQLIAVLPEGLLSSAGHAAFREWLLTRARVLAVISLPHGSCFRGTGVKCSLLLLTRPASRADYPILMVDVEQGDLDRGLEAVNTKLRDFLDREVRACA